MCFMNIQNIIFILIHSNNKFEFIFNRFQQFFTYYIRVVTFNFSTKCTGSAIVGTIYTSPLVISNVLGCLQFI